MKEIDQKRLAVRVCPWAPPWPAPLGQSLHEMAPENRDMRMNEAEKTAAALAPKLTVPTILFVLPVLFVVIGGCRPASRGPATKKPGRGRAGRSS